MRLLCNTLRSRRFIRWVSRYFPSLTSSDQAKIAAMAGCLSIRQHKFTSKEFRQIRKRGLAIALDREVIEQLDRSFEYMYECQHWMRIGTFNYICGLGLNGAIQNYDRISCAVERGDKDVKLVCKFR